MLLNQKFVGNFIFFFNFFFAIIKKPKKKLVAMELLHHFSFGVNTPFIFCSKIVFSFFSGLGVNRAAQTKPTAGGGWGGSLVGTILQWLLHPGVTFFRACEPPVSSRSS